MTRISGGKSNIPLLQKKKEKLVKLKLEQTSIEKNATVKFMEPVKTTGF